MSKLESVRCINVWDRLCGTEYRLELAFENPKDDIHVQIPQRSFSQESLWEMQEFCLLHNQKNNSYSRNSGIAALKNSKD